MNNFFPSLVPYMTDTNKESVFSPYSIYSILAMTSGGSSGNTLKEFCELLFCDEETIHEGMKGMHQVMKSKQLKIAEAIFTQVNILKEFRDVCVSNYEAMVTKTTFPEPGVNEVNEFVKKSTRGMIPTMVDRVHPLTKMILINAIYFKGKWKTQFKKKETLKRQKFSSHGKVMRVDYLFRKNTKEMYFRNTEKLYTSCMLPYVGNTFSMVFIKPGKAGPEEMENVLKNVICDPNFMNEVFGKQKEVKLARLKIPKFVIESSYEMKDILIKMGLVDAFKDDGVADFSKMTDDEKIFIDQVIHKAKIIVDEVGTTAAASTAVVMRSLSVSREEKPEFLLNRPFFCFIVHNRTKTILFGTTVVAPKFKK